MERAAGEKAGENPGTPCGSKQKEGINLHVPIHGNIDLNKEVFFMKNWKGMICGALALLMLAGCTEKMAEGLPDIKFEEGLYVDQVSLKEVELADEAVALASAPALPEGTTPVASGTAVKKNSKAEVDYSNVSDGYVMARFIAQSDKVLRVQVAGPTSKYTYYINQGEWVTFPLPDGNGDYTVKVYEKKLADPKDTKYLVSLSVTFTAELKDEFAPFLRPNQFVNYASAKDTLAKAEELLKDETDTLKKVEKVYNFVVDNLTYDKNKAATVQKGYVPVLDDVLKAKTGICFDYAALMTGMLRAQGVPCKLVVGYAGTAYHAWISVWTEETGWVDGAIFFDGTTWQRMDPTFASSGKGSAAIMEYIGDGKNYTAQNFF